jgi:simple sugar transport system ATP-binding protein
MDAGKLASAMVGEAREEPLRKERTAPGKPRLELDLCSVSDTFGRRELDACNLRVHAGEIVAIAGVEGNGQRPLAEVLFGLRAPNDGTVRFDGQPLPPIGDWSRRRVPIGRIPEDRRHHGLVLDAPLWENLLLGPQPPRFGRVLRRRAVMSWAREMLEEYRVSPPDPGMPAANLSGGNQQKVVIARELAGDPQAVIAVNPTRGLDIRAQQEVQQRLLDARGRHAAVLVVSTDLDEVFELADCIAVLYEGRLLGPFPRDEVSRDRVGLLMGGADDG